MAVVWDHCKTKTICEADEPREEGAEGDGDEPKKGHGGCGHQQPQIRKEGLKMFVQYKKSKDDDDVRTIPSALYFLYSLFPGDEILATRQATNHTVGDFDGLQKDF